MEDLKQREEERKKTKASREILIGFSSRIYSLCSSTLPELIHKDYREHRKMKKIEDRMLEEERIKVLIQNFDFLFQISIFAANLG